MNSMFYCDKFEDDWIISDNIGIKGISKIIKKGIKTTSPIPLDSKSTTGGNAKQYDLFEYLQYNSVMDKVKEKILLNLKRHLQLKLSDLKLLSAWTVLGYKNSYHTLHKHNEKQNHVASVLYLKVPNSPPRKKGSFYYLSKNGQEINCGRLSPKVGDLVIFPIWLWHGVYPQPEGLRQTLNLDFEICY